MSRKNELTIDDLLKPDMMMHLYTQGAFPMADDENEINWYMPEVRTIIPINEFNIPRSMKKVLAENKFEIRYDYNQLEVIKNCADRESTWISEKLISAYKNLIDLEFLHSVETYFDNELAGGLYGVSFRGAFFGESMFSKVPQASKTALVKLVERLKEKQFVLIDVQYQTEHLKMFGAREITFEEYSKYLKKAYKGEVFF
jgi:leucyl/phenylalanyl-tRNA---protein transferase